ncbi:MAG: SPASM domain-containing protein [archaeon]
MILAGADTIRLSAPWSHFVHNKKVKNTIQDKTPKKILELIENLHEQFPDKIKVRYNQPKKPFNKCYVMAMTSAISPEGNVYPCPETCASFFSQLSYGNIKKHKFSKIWQGLKHQEIFKTLNPQIHGCRCCTIDSIFNELCENISQNQNT